MTQGEGMHLEMFLSLRGGGQEEVPKEQGIVGARGSPKQPVTSSWHKSWARAPETSSPIPREWRPWCDSVIQQNIDCLPCAGPTLSTLGGHLFT